MAHGFSGAEDLRGKGMDIPYGKIFDFLTDNLWRLRKQQENIAVRVNEIQNTLEGKPQNQLPPGARMLSGKDPKGFISSGGPTALPPGGPRLPGDTGPRSGGRKGGTYSKIPGIAPDGGGGLNASSFLNKETGDVEVEAAFKAGISPEDLKAAVRRGRAIKRSKGISITSSSGNGEETAAQGTEALVKTRQEAIKTAAAVNSPAIAPDSGSDIVAAVNRNTEAILGLVKVTKEQTRNDTKLTERQTAFQEKMFSRQQASAEENSLEQQSIRHGFSKNFSEKYKEKKTGAGPGGQGYSGQLGRSGPNVMDMLDIGSDIMDMRKGRVRRITQGRDGRTSRQRLRDMKARKAGLRPSSRGVRPSGGVRPRGGGLNRGAGLAKALTGGAKGSGLGGLKGAAKGFGKAGPLALLTAGLEFGDRMASGQNALQAGVGTAGSVGGGLAGAAAGAAIGSVVPILGTAVGGLLGGWLGSMAGGGLADAATGANNVTAMASGGVLVGEAGLEGVFPLSGKEGLKTFTMFGEGLFNYQKDNKHEFAKLQSAGLKQYYENEGGFTKMGEGLGDAFKGITDALGGVVSGLGGVLSALAGGSASAATLSGSNFAGNMSADEQQLTEALIAAEEGVKTEAYQDSEGIWTIGYGQTTLNGRAVKQGDKISKEEALTGFRSNVKSHAQRAINQVGEKRWQELDPKARAVLTSLAYNYGSIPKAVLPAAKSGSTEDIAKSMDALYGHNKGVLKGRRQREQSVLRGNLQGDAGNAVRLDKDFMAGGKFAGAGSGPMIAGVPPGASPGSGSLAAAAESLRGMSTRDGPGKGNVSCVYAVNKVFNKAGMTPPWGGAQDTLSVIRGVKAAGWQEVGFDQAQPGDVWVYDNGSTKGHVGIKTADGKVLSNSSSNASFTWAADQAALRFNYPEAGLTPPGGTFFRPPSAGSVTQPSSPIASSPVMSPIFNRPGATPAGAPTPAAPPSAVPATPAAANTGTPMMTTSAQVANGQVASAQPIVVNNYYTGVGGGQTAQMVPNSLNAGISMDNTGLAAFQQLRLRSLG